MQSANSTDDDPESRAADMADRDSDVQSSTNGLHIRNESDDDEDGAPVPVWMQESSKSFKYRWVPLPLRKSGRAMLKWIKGPLPPQELHIKPWWPAIQEAPLRILDRYVPNRRYKICLQLLLYVVWSLTWSLMLKHNSTSGYIEGYGKPSNIWCGASFWFVIWLRRRPTGTRYLTLEQERRKRLWPERQQLSTFLFRAYGLPLPSKLRLRSPV